MGWETLYARNQEWYEDIKGVAKVYDANDMPYAPIKVWHHVFEACRKLRLTHWGGHEIRDAGVRSKRSAKRPKESLL